MRIKQHYSIRHLNTFGIDVKTRAFLNFISEKDILEFYDSLLYKKELYNCPKLILGGGSNMLFTSDYDGIVIHPENKGHEIVEETGDFVFIKVEAGYNWDEFVQLCVSNQWYGAENLSYIPGNVGAAPIQNIGAYGVEAKDIIYDVHSLDIDNLTKKKYHYNECGFGYRDSIFKKTALESTLITAVTFQLSKKKAFNFSYEHVKEAVEKFGEVNLKNIRKAIVWIRQQKLPEPENIGNAGSFFKNPVIPREQFLSLQSLYPDIRSYPVSEANVKIPAGWLIDKLGWKGKSHKGAAVYDKQALILINKNNATGKDVLELSEQIRASVFDKFKIQIQPEVNIVADRNPK